MKNSCFPPHLKGIYCVMEEIILSEKIEISDKKKSPRNKILQKCDFTEEKVFKKQCYYVLKYFETVPFSRRKPNVNILYGYENIHIFVAVRLLNATLYIRGYNLF